MRSFLSQLNTRQLVIYFIGTWLFVYAAHTLTTLYDFSFLYDMLSLANRSIYKERYSTDLFIINLGGYAGLIAAYIIAWRFTTIKNWFWANAVIVFLVVFVLYFFNLLGWQVMGKVFLGPGLIFSDQNTVIGLLADSLIMLGIGYLLFFNKNIIKYIDKGVKREKGKGALKVAGTSKK